MRDAARRGRRARRPDRACAGCATVAPQRQAEQRPAHPADVEERHRHLQHVGAGDARLGPPRCPRGASQAAVGEHRALREARGARGVELQEAVVGRGGVVAGVGLVGGEEGLVLVVRHPDDALHGGRVRPQPVDDRGELGPDEQDAGPRVGDHVDDLRRGEPEVHHRVRRADLRAGQRQLHRGGVVEVEHGDAVARRDPGRAQRRGEPLHAPDQRRPRGVGAREADRHLVRAFRRPGLDDRGEVPGSCGVRHAPDRSGAGATRAR